MMKNLFYIMFLVGILFKGTWAEAAIIYLKDGRTVEGTIVNRNSYSITVRSGAGVPAKFFNDQVERILEDKDFGSNPLGVEAAKVDPSAPRKTNLVLTLLEVNGTLEKMRSNINLAIDQSGVDNKINLQNLFNINEMAQKLVPIYGEYYSESELEALVQFYQSPLGKKLLQTSPAVLERTMKAHVEYFQEKLAPVPK